MSHLDSSTSLDTAQFHSSPLRRWVGGVVPNGMISCFCPPHKRFCADDGVNQFFENRVTLEFECERVCALYRSVPLELRLGKGLAGQRGLNKKTKAKSTQLKGLILAQNER